MSIYNINYLNEQSVYNNFTKAAKSIEDNKVNIKDQYNKAIQMAKACNDLSRKISDNSVNTFTIYKMYIGDSIVSSADDCQFIANGIDLKSVLTNKDQYETLKNKVSEMIKPSSIKQRKINCSMSDCIKELNNMLNIQKNLISKFNKSSDSISNVVNSVIKLLNSNNADTKYLNNNYLNLVQKAYNHDFDIMVNANDVIIRQVIVIRKYIDKINK